jgi:hypothetical protein
MGWVLEAIEEPPYSEIFFFGVINYYSLMIEESELYINVIGLFE